MMLGYNSTDISNTGILEKLAALLQIWTSTYHQTRPHPLFAFILILLNPPSPRLHRRSLWTIPYLKQCLWHVCI